MSTARSATYRIDVAATHGDQAVVDGHHGMHRAAVLHRPRLAPGAGCDVVDLHRRQELLGLGLRWEEVIPLAPPPGHSAGHKDLALRRGARGVVPGRFHIGDVGPRVAGDIVHFRSGDDFILPVVQALRRAAMVRGRELLRCSRRQGAAPDTRESSPK